MPHPPSLAQDAAYDDPDPTDGALDGLDPLAPQDPDRLDRGLAWTLVVGGLVALAGAFTLVLERLELLRDPDYVPTCSINPIINCGSVMQTDQAALFGFPNPLIALMTFPVVVVTGVVLLAGVRLPRWYWAGLQLGVTLGLAFIVWLASQSLYVIDALCPYCMVVWAAMVPIALLVTLRNARAGLFGERGRTSRAVVALEEWRVVVVVAVYLGVVALILQAFWSYWSTLV